MDKATLHCPLCSTPIFSAPIIPKREKSNIGLQESFHCSSMGHNHHNDIYWCGHCLNGFLQPMPTAAELNELYNGVVDETYLREKAGRYHTFRHDLKVLSRYCKPGKILEIGSYCGFFLDVAQAAGFKVFGIEPSKWASDYGREVLGLNSKQGNFDYNTVKNLFGDQLPFEVIASWDVLEHVANPKLFLSDVSKLLKKDGIFAFSTLNIDNWWVKLSGKRWPWYMQMHLFYFTKRSLQALLEENGMELIHSEAYQHIISVAYFFKKVQQLLGLPFTIDWSAIPILKSQYIPFFFGDIIMIIARKK